MRTSLKWIKDLVPGIEDLTPQEYLDAMTLSGSKGEYYVELDKNLENIVVGQILKNIRALHSVSALSVSPCSNTKLMTCIISMKMTSDF